MGDDTDSSTQSEANSTPEEKERAIENALRTMTGAPTEKNSQALKEALKGVFSESFASALTAAVQPTPGPNRGRSATASHIRPFFKILYVPLPWAAVLLLFLYPSLYFYLRPNNWPTKPSQCQIFLPPLYYALLAGAIVKLRDANAKPRSAIKPVANTSPSHSAPPASPPSEAISQDTPAPPEANASAPRRKGHKEPQQ